MKGLLKNNFFTVWTNAKVFSLFMLIAGIFIVAFPLQSFQIAYAIVGIVGFSVNAAAVVKYEFISKWGKYKLTLPVTRADIVKSYFINQILWLLAGTAFVGIPLGLSWLLHGSSFDRPIDTLTLTALSVSISLFTGALFFPCFYLGGSERSDVFLILAQICAFFLDWIIISVINQLSAPGIPATLIGVGVLMLFSLLAFCLSYPLTIHIYRKKEY